MSKKNLLIQLIPWSPLIVFLNLLPFIRSAINLKLLFGIELGLIGFLFLKYRKDLLAINIRTEKEPLETFRKGFNIRIVLIGAGFTVIGFFLIINYILEVLKR